MANKMVTAIIVIVVVVAVVCVAYVALSGDDEEDDTIGSSAAGLEYDQLMIYGNANGDFTIDDSDLQIIEMIIDTEMADWDSYYPLADANYDGSIDQSDVELVQDIIDGNSCTVYLRCLDLNEEDIVVSATYPMQHIAVFGLDMINAALYSNAGDYIVAYGAHEGDKDDYPVALASLGGTAFSGTNTIDWQTFMEIDDATPISALFIASNQVSTFLDSEGTEIVEESGIPLIVYATADPWVQAAAAATIGFLCGDETAYYGELFAELSSDVLDAIEAETSSLSEDEKSTFILTKMMVMILGYDNESQSIGLIAGGIRYSDVNEEFESHFSSGYLWGDAETLANYQDVDAYVPLRSMDFASDYEDFQAEVVSQFTNETWGCDALEFFYGVLDRVYMINNILPAVLKVAYMAEALYPDMFEGYGDEVMQSFIDAGFAPLEGQTTDTVVGCITYADYLAAIGE